HCHNNKPGCYQKKINIKKYIACNPAEMPSKLQMLKAGVIWLIGTDGSGHNELASCVLSRRSVPINQMTSSNIKKKSRKNPVTLTGVIWLIGIVRRLETQRASSLCPKPSVPINQMTPAFNIWGLLGWLVKLSFEILNYFYWLKRTSLPRASRVLLNEPQMLKAGVIWLIGTDGSRHNELASCVPSRRSMPINQMTPVNA
ncbi:hypothetical protein TYRP_016775, partial [Tyrophagus putrescentiae]